MRNKIYALPAFTILLTINAFASFEVSYQRISRIPVANIFGYDIAPTKAAVIDEAGKVVPQYLESNERARLKEISSGLSELCKRNALAVITNIAELKRGFHKDTPEREFPYKGSIVIQSIYPTGECRAILSFEDRKNANLGFKTQFHIGKKAISTAEIQERLRQEMTVSEDKRLFETQENRKVLRQLGID